MSTPKHTPTSDPSRRRFLHASSLVGLGGLMGTSLTACGGSDDPPDPLTASSSEVLEAVQRGTLSAEACANTLIARAKQQADLNSPIFLNDTAALAAARQIDLDRQAGKPLKPLAGLFIVVKDNINTADMPTTSGTPSLQGARPSTTAPSLKRLTDAGAIVLAKANLHELAFGITSTNLSFAKPVKNPYDKTRIPGGSSGGTAAAIAAGIVSCGLGTDTGGSTRVPAALCGVVGLRPSVGNGGAQRRYTDTNAVMPISRTRDTMGPLGRTVADVALLDSVITQTPQARMASLQGAFAAIQADVFGPAYPDAINIHRPALQKLYADAFAQNKVEALLFPTTLLAATPMDLVKGSSTVSVNGGPPVDTFGTYIRNTDPGSNAGLSGLSVPAGLNAAGLPVGMELDGPVGSDQRLLSLGLALEAALGRVPAPKL